MRPFRIHVITTSSDEVKALRLEVDQLRTQLHERDDQLRQAEYRLGCEVNLNSRLLDLCRESGVKVPRSVTSWTKDR